VQLIFQKSLYPWTPVAAPPCVHVAAWTFRATPWQGNRSSADPDVSRTTCMLAAATPGSRSRQRRGPGVPVVARRPAAIGYPLSQPPIQLLLRPGPGMSDRDERNVRRQTDRPRRSPNIRGLRLLRHRPHLRADGPVLARLTAPITHHQIGRTREDRSFSGNRATMHLAGTTQHG
jgi:hypothetical protein